MSARKSPARTPAQHQAASLARRRRAGGRPLYVVLTPAGNKALNALLANGGTQVAIVSDSLIQAAKSK